MRLIRTLVDGEDHEAVLGVLDVEVVLRDLRETGHDDQHTVVENAESALSQHFEQMGLALPDGGALVVAFFAVLLIAIAARWGRVPSSGQSPASVSGLLDRGPTRRGRISERQFKPNRYAVWVPIGYRDRPGENNRTAAMTGHGP